jgi:hypothetical protein
VRRDVIGLFNWSDTESLQIEEDLGRIGLDATKQYIGYDFWERKFVGAFSRQLRQTVPAGSCRVIAVRLKKPYPQLISTSRHIAQCMIDVFEERWDPVTKTLSGISRVAGGDPYELRIALPESGGYRALQLYAENARMRPGGKSSFGITPVIETDRDQAVKWHVRFQTD